MKLWTVWVGGENILELTKEEHDKSRLILLDKMKTEQSLEKDWKKISFIVDVSRDDYHGKPVPDLIEGVVVEAISNKTKLLVEPLISGQVEYLPIDTPFGPYYELNVKRVNCLNIEKSVVIRFKSSGRIRDVEEYSFHLEKLKKVHIFRLPELGLSKLFVSNELKGVIEKNELKGFVFREVPMAIIDK